MDKLRDILLPNASQDRIQIVLSKIKEIEDAIGEGKDVRQLIETFNDYTGKNYDKEYFQTYWKSENIEDFARDAAQPVPQKLDDITQEELVEIVERIRNGDDNTEFYLAVLNVNLPHPRISDLIFWPENEGLSDESTSEEIVEVAINYKPMQL